jgi:membrane protein implicated in regulation of membrane protease activity
MMPYVWIAVIITAVVAESMTSALVAIWFMPSAIVSMILAFFGVPILVQVLVFMLVSALLIILSKMIFKNVLKVRPTPTNADTVIGESAVVTERICNMENKGLVKVRGQIWSAKSADGADIEQGDIESVISIEGVKLICRK